jgi:hypothetical protein
MSTKKAKGYCLQKSIAELTNTYILFCLSQATKSNNIENISSPDSGLLLTLNC